MVSLPVVSEPSRFAPFRAQTRGKTIYRRPHTTFANFCVVAFTYQTASSGSSVHLAFPIASCTAGDLDPKKSLHPS
jgi:hypothetical protein